MEEIGMWLVLAALVIAVIVDYRVIPYITFLGIIVFVAAIVRENSAIDERKRDISETEKEMSEIEDLFPKLAEQKRICEEKLKSAAAQKERLLTDYTEMKRFDAFFLAFTGSSFSPETALRALKEQIAHSALLQSDAESKLRDLDAEIASLEGKMLSLHESLLRRTG